MSSSDIHEFLEHVSITKRDGVFVIDIDAPVIINNTDNIIVTGKNLLVVTKGVTQIESQFIYLNSLEKHPRVRSAIIKQISSLGQSFIKLVSKGESLSEIKQIIDQFLVTNFGRTLSVKSVLKKEVIKVPSDDNTISK